MSLARSQATLEAALMTSARNACYGRANGQAALFIFAERPNGVFG
ncbi:MAG: hypothetical protein WCL57_06370 [Chloroflexota bacterium]